ncbi:hypothetical protein TIFTF001_035702 [Ficus carica]|uniref:Uncharacterized protein n=1 Tax=Ficus carica TaxID=3494 RepID=A0AA88E2T4_FICCA|nr:hypothetical protein TIFTF001_035702 [Ficus carica]
MPAAGTHWIAWRSGSGEATNAGDSWGPRSAAGLGCTRGTHENSPLDWLDARLEKMAWRVGKPDEKRGGPRELLPIPKVAHGGIC